MSSKISYILVFSIIFGFVTLAMAYLDSIYMNIFELDFRPAVVSTALSASANNKKVGSIEQDSLNSYADSLLQSNNQKMISLQKTLQDSIKKLNDIITKLNEQNQINNNQIAELQKLKKDKLDYEDWKKRTLQLYEIMDSKKVAKIIQNYSDDIARDLIFSMKKKKAAEVLAQYSPDVALKLMKEN